MCGSPPVLTSPRRDHGRDGRSVTVVSGSLPRHGFADWTGTGLRYRERRSAPGLTPAALPPLTRWVGQAGATDLAGMLSAVSILKQRLLPKVCDTSLRVELVGAKTEAAVRLLCAIIFREHLEGHFAAAALACDALDDCQHGLAHACAFREVERGRMSAGGRLHARDRGRRERAEGRRWRSIAHRAHLEICLQQSNRGC